MSTITPPTRSGRPLALGLVVLGLVLFGLAILYGLGVVNLLATHPGPHLKHAVLLVVLGVVSLVAANFARRR